MNDIDKVIQNINKLENERSFGKLRGEALAARIKARDRKQRVLSQKSGILDQTSLSRVNVGGATRQSRLVSAK